jgi:hypothetical protein
MSKEAYWFKHDSNAKDDPKCIILIEELGLEGYGIFWVLVETLRAQPHFKAPLRILPAIARRHNTSTEKVKAVVSRYDLFEVEEEEFFYSPSLTSRMKPLVEKKKALIEAGKKGAEKRWGNKNRVANRVVNGVANGNKSREDKKREDINYVQYVDLWNDVNDCSLRITDKKREQIRARLGTYSEDELKKSIKNRAKNSWINGEGKKYKSDWNSFWRNDEKPERYLKEDKTNRVLDGGVW